MEAQGSVNRTERGPELVHPLKTKKGEEDPASAQLYQEMQENLLKTTQAPELLRMLLNE